MPVGAAVLSVPYKTEKKVDNIEDMAFFQNILLSNKRVDTNMEAGNHHSDVELDVIEAGSRSAHYAHSLYPDSMSLDPGSTFPCSFRAPNSRSEGGNHVPPLLLPPAQISSTSFSTSLNNRRWSQNDDKISTKVRVVEQGSNMPIRVCLHAIKIEILRK